MSANEDVEIKGGHPPAVKVGGVRITQKAKLEDGGTAKPRKNSENGEEDFKSPLKAPVMVQTQTMGKPERDFPSAAVKHTQEKPVPTHDTRPAHTKPSVIQQPRK